MTRARWLAGIGLVAACGGGADSGTPINDSGPSNDSSVSCDVFVTFEPELAYADPATRIRAVANVVNAPGISTYTWQVRRAGVDLPFVEALPGLRAVEFAGDVAGPIDVLVGVDAPGVQCPTGQAAINVAAPGSNVGQVRIRVFPPSTIAAPPSEKLVFVQGGANYSVGAIAIDPGTLATGQLTANGVGVPAYLRFIPLSSPDAYVEAYASTTGAFAARVLVQPHDVLVVPLVPGFAPTVVTWSPGMGLAIGAGTAVSGVVRGPTGAAIAGAKVKLTIEGVPSTLATTDAAGAFTVRATLFAGATVTVEATPPAATGLPRLIARSNAFALAQPLDVRYASGLAIRDVGGATVRRGGAAQAGAQVAIVGKLASAGTVTAGVAIAASGEVRTAATANASGVLPALRAPAAPLSAVVTLGPGDHAVTAINLTTTTPATIDAPPMVAIATQIRDGALAGLPEAVFEAIPTGALAMAGADPVRVASGAEGMLGAQLAAGGRYDLRLTDPTGHAAPLRVADVAATGVAAAYTLPAALRLSGSLVLTGNPSPVGYAAVQILCTQCTGVDRNRPLAEAATSESGDFGVAVLDPGTMPP